MAKRGEMGWRLLAIWLAALAVTINPACRNGEDCTTGSMPEVLKRWQLQLPGDAYLYPTLMGPDFLLSWYSDGHQCFATVGRKDGCKKQQWCCAHDAPAPLYYNLQPAFFENILLLPAPRGLLVLADGTCRMLEVPYASGEPSVTVHKGIAYRVYYSTGQRLAHLTAHDLKKDSLTVLTTIDAPDSASIFLKNPFLSFDEKNGKILVAGYTYYWPSNHLTRNGVLRIALPEGRILSNQLLTPPNSEARGLNQHPVVWGNLSFWTAQTELICYDHVRNSIRWRRQMPAPMVTSRMLVHDGSLYFAAEDGMLYAIALPSGALQWLAPVSGSPGRVFPSGEFLFVVGGSDGVLHGIRRNDGAVVLKMRSPRHDISTGIFYQRTAWADENGVLLFDGNYWRYFSLNMPCKGQPPTLPVSGK